MAWIRFVPLASFPLSKQSPLLRFFIVKIVPSKGFGVGLGLGEVAGIFVEDKLNPEGAPVFPSFPQFW